MQAKYQEITFTDIDIINKDLQTEFEYLTSDEQLAENAATNDYTFTINGEREG